MQTRPSGLPSPSVGEGGDYEYVPAVRRIPKRHAIGCEVLLAALRAPTSLRNGRRLSTSFDLRCGLISWRLTVGSPDPSSGRLRCGASSDRLGCRPNHDPLRRIREGLDLAESGRTGRAEEHDAAIINSLLEDHRNMATLLHILDQELQVFDRGERPDFDELSGIIEYFRTYPSQVHHPEEALFAARLARRNPGRARTISEYSRSTAQASRHLEGVSRKPGRARRLGWRRS